MSTSTAHFSISGEFITDHARNLWQERKFAKAFDLLGCLIGATREQHEAIIFGKAKLTGVNDVELEEDDWTPPEGYATFSQALTQGQHFEEIERRREDEAWRYAHDNWWTSRGTRWQRTQFFNHLKSLVGEEKAESITQEVMLDRANQGPEDGGYYASCQLGLEAKDRDKEAPAFEPTKPSMHEMARHAMMGRLEMMGMDISAMPTTDAMLYRGTELVPTLCQDMNSVNGWLLPTGKYYGCGSMEHIGLAENLLKKSHPNSPRDPEVLAEELGWVKITRGMGGLYVHCKNKPNQKQIDKLHVYAEYHKLDFKKMTEHFHFFE